LQEEIANELEHVNATGQSVIDTLKNFPISRSLLIAQITKRQNVEDFRYAPPSTTCASMAYLNADARTITGRGCPTSTFITN
jgi:hypothetical protein